MFVDDLRRTKAKEHFQAGQENEQIVELARSQNDVGNEIERHDQVRERGRNQQLWSQSHTRILEQAREESDEFRQVRKQPKEPAPAELSHDEGSFHGHSSHAANSKGGWVTRLLKFGGADGSRTHGL